MKDYITKNGGILGAFALVTTGLIALTNYYTAPVIAAETERQLLSVLNQLVPEHLHDNDLHLDCIILDDSALTQTKAQQRVFRARMQNENIALIIESTTPNGYSGNIDLVVAINAAGDSMGTRVIKHKETPGLGDKIDLRVSDWILSFNDVPLNDNNQSRWQVKKDGGQFDQFTGATITPRAVVEAVKDTVLFAQQNADDLYNSPSNCASTNIQDSLTIEESTYE